MYISSKKIRVSLLTQMALLITIVVFISTFLIITLFSSILDEIIEHYIGQQAMTVAKLTANNKEIIKAFDEEHPSKKIQPVAEGIRKTTGADYVTVANTKGIRYSHPNPNYIGRHTATSNDASIKKHHSVIYKGNGVSGAAIKAKTPIWNSNGEVIGVSSVGFLINNIEKQIFEYRTKIIKLSIIPLIVGVMGALLIARRVKKLIFGLEPEEISFLFKEKEATLESIRDATVTVNIEERVTSMNKRARELFDDHQLVLGGIIKNEYLSDLIKEVIRKKDSQTNKNLLLGHQLYVLDLSPILKENEVKGIVLTIRTVSEIEQLTAEFSKIRTFSENMRAQNHEFLNKLNTIYGLISLKQYDKALEIISSEVKERQDTISFLVSSVKDPLIAACLLGKINRAKELKVNLEIEHDSSLTNTLTMEESKNLVSIIGNVIDNALEAAREKNELNGKVKVSFTDLGKDIIFDIEDNGLGIPKGMESTIFIDGYTTKREGNHGLGLAIVKSSIALFNGEIYIGSSPLGGARFTVVVPKNSVFKKEE